MLKTQKYMEIVRSRGQRKLPLNRVYRMIRQRDLFLTAYGKLYANKGAMNPGVNPNDIVDGMSLSRIDKIIDQLTEGTYQWTPVKRTYINKKTGGKRPLGKPSWNDKLLQEVGVFVVKGRKPTLRINPFSNYEGQKESALLLYRTDTLRTPYRLMSSK